MKDLYLLCFLILLDCSQNKQQAIKTIEQLLNQDKIIQAYNRFEEYSKMCLNYLIKNFSRLYS